MGWADCGEDQWGRPIGYAFPAICDHEGCTAEIDRGLGCICNGAMHNDHSEDGCGLYYCGEHQTAHPCPLEMAEADADAFWERWFARMADPVVKAAEVERRRVMEEGSDGEAIIAAIRKLDADLLAQREAASG